MLAAAKDVADNRAHMHIKWTEDESTEKEREIANIAMWIRWDGFCTNGYYRPTKWNFLCKRKQIFLVQLTTWRKKLKSSLSDAAGVVGFGRTVVGLARRVVVGIFCNKSSISLMLIGIPVVLLLLVIFIFSVVVDRVFPRLKYWNQNSKINRHKFFFHSVSL